MPKPEDYKNPENYKNEVANAWCPGCTNFGVLAAVRQALATLGVEPHRAVIVSGIGQAAKLPHYLKTNVFNGLHGRAVPAATAIKLMRPELTVMVTTGDGDCYGEGGNHFLHAVRRDPDITVIVHNNEVYALTKGQASPTTERGAKTRLQFDGVTDEPLDPLALSLVAGCRFVARGYAGDIAHLSDIIIEGARHGGLAVIDVIQPCITWGKKLSPYYKDKIYRIGAEHDRSNFDAALKLLRTSSEKIPTGVFYKKEKAAADLSHYSGDTAGKEAAGPTLSENATEILAELLKDFK